MPYPPGITSRQYHAKFGTSDEALWERYRDEVVKEDDVRAAIVREITATFDDLALTFSEEAVKKMVAAVDLEELLRHAVPDAGAKLDCFPCYETWSEQQIEGAIEWARDSASGGAL